MYTFRVRGCNGKGGKGGRRRFAVASIEYLHIGKLDISK